IETPASRATSLRVERFDLAAPTAHPLERGDGRAEVDSRSRRRQPGAAGPTPAPSVRRHHNPAARPALRHVRPGEPHPPTILPPGKRPGTGMTSVRGRWGTRT